MGWTNTAEMTASVVDAVNALSRIFINANSETPIDPIPLMPRPYEAPVEPVKPDTVSFAKFCDIVAIE